MDKSIVRFNTHEVFLSTLASNVLPKIFRILDIQESFLITAIDVDVNAESSPFTISYEKFIDYLESGMVVKVGDPYASIPSIPANLPPAASERLSLAKEVFAEINEKRAISKGNRSVAEIINSAAKRHQYSSRTIKRWVIDYLKSGRNAAEIGRAHV